ncbi:MAG: hypothetical protein IBX40_11880 [Methanosarcinales archaeon]|nr:hypothetical protein [Methanosarcinales archaeon]
MNQGPECHMLRLSLQSKTPDLHSNPERGSGGGAPDILTWWDYCNVRTKTHGN